MFHACEQMSPKSHNHIFLLFIYCVFFFAYAVWYKTQNAFFNRRRRRRHTCAPTTAYYIVNVSIGQQTKVSWRVLGIYKYQWWCCTATDTFCRQPSSLHTAYTLRKVLVVCDVFVCVRLPHFAQYVHILYDINNH